MKKIGGLLVLFACLSFSANAAEGVGDEVKRVIIKRCRGQMNQYGAMMVKACVDQDIAAVVAINKYPVKYAAIVERCMGQMHSYGFVMIKACADEDIAAEESLSNY